MAQYPSAVGQICGGCGNAKTLAITDELQAGRPIYRGYCNHCDIDLEGFWMVADGTSGNFQAPVAASTPLPPLAEEPITQEEIDEAVESSPLATTESFVPALQSLHPPETRQPRARRRTSVSVQAVSDEVSY